MGTAERRNAIIKILCRRRYETIHNLAREFDVSERTIRRDIEVLSYTEPIYTQPGRYYGGVYVVDGYTIDRMYMSEIDLSILHKLAKAAEANLPCQLSSTELLSLNQMIATYTKPKR